MNYPFVSLLVPIRNEARYIEKCLSAIHAQDYPHERLELLIADGMSDDGTREIVTGFVQQHPSLSTRMVDNPGKIVATGLNIALRHARGEIIVRVDGHCEIEDHYIKHCVLHLVYDGVDGVGGSMETIGETPLAKTISLAMSSVFGVGDSAFRTISGKTMLVDSIPFPAYTRTVMERAGRYDEELVRNQDDEYNYRLRKLGAKILLSADVRSKYYSRSSLQSLWRQYYRYGFYKVRVLQKHPRQMRPRQFVPPAFVFALLVSICTIFMIPWGIWLYAFIAGAYLLVNLIASILTAWKRGWRHLPALPLIFSILHVSYGLGFLTGLLHFAGRWGDRTGKVPSLSFE